MSMSHVQLRILRLPGNDDLPTPARATAEAAGLDLSAAVEADLTIPQGQIAMIPCGFAMALPPGFEGQVRARSGLASRNGITPVNAPGTIDSDYRGEVKVPLINLGQADFVVTRGMRIAQLVVARVPSVDVTVVDDLDDTARGSGGFGHTGT